MSNVILIIACLLLPVTGCLLLLRRKKNVWISFLIGALCFFLSQTVLRIPILSMLQKNLAFQMWTWGNPLIYLVLLAFSAGLFEEAARYIGFYCSKKHHDHLLDAIAFGLGHGGIEAILMVLLPAILTSNLSLEQSLIASFERVVSIFAHVGFSIFVWYSVHTHKRRYLGAAILLHMLVDMMVGLPFSIYGIEASIAAMTLCIWWFCYVLIIRRVKQYEESLFLF